MPSDEENYDEAMLDFSQGDLDTAIRKFKVILDRNPGYFDAQLALGMAYYRQGNYAAAIAEGHKAEQLKPKEQLAHTNLSLFYMKSGNKQAAEHHGLQARIAAWKDNLAQPVATSDNPELQISQRPPPPVKFPAMPWKKKPADPNPPNSSKP